MTYQESLNFLFSSLPMFQRVGAAAYKAGLDTTWALDEYFGHPHTKFLTIHVAGTNGKGSTSHMLASVLMKAGYRVGLYTSPHLRDFRERIMVNGVMIPEERVTAFVCENRPIIEQLTPSFFEMTVALAFDHFAREKVDVAVIEVGMGGRLDSTNIITPLVSVITNIAFDHMQFLGDTLPKIAGEKAGIIKSGVPVVIGETDPETAPVFLERADACDAPIRFADQHYLCTESTPNEHGQQLTLRDMGHDCEFTQQCDLAGDCQRLNVPTVLATLDALSQEGTLHFTPENIRAGIAEAAATTHLRGRWQILGHNPFMVCDTGHNEAGLRLVTEQIKRQKYHKLYIVFGVVSDKDLDHELPLLPDDAYYFFTRASIQRAMPSEELYRRATAFGLRGEEVPQGVAAALERARAVASPDDMIYIGGSTFIVAEII